MLISLTAFIVVLLAFAILGKIVNAFFRGLAEFFQLIVLLLTLLTKFMQWLNRAILKPRTELIKLRGYSRKAGSCG